MSASSSRVDVRRPEIIAAITVGALLLSGVFFAPRLWLMRDYLPGTFQWDRGQTFLLQCAEPFRRDIEPAMLWRLLPPLVAHGLGLTGQMAFLIPWAGIIALLGYTAVLHARRLTDARFVFGGTLLVATTSAVLVPVGWLGLNDAWVWLGLLAVAFARAPWSLGIACLLCPWVDERFLIGLPLAWITRCVDLNLPFFSRQIYSAAWLLPYIGLRIALGGSPTSNPIAGQFLSDQMATTLITAPLAPLGWWMGLRAGWAGVCCGAWFVDAERRAVLLILLATTATFSLFLASDVSRSIAIIVPVMVLGVFAVARLHPARAPTVVLFAGGINLLIPAAHVVLDKIDPISPLPVEIFRLWRAH